MKAHLSGVLLIFALYCKAHSEPSSAKNELIAIETNSEDDKGSENSKENEEIQNNEIFHPTEEWQIIKPGQAIPAGLHIRINLQTGKKEARLLKESKSQEQEVNNNGLNFAKLDSEERTAYEQHKVLDPKEVREALKSLKSDESERSYKNAEQVQKKFRSIHDLKKEFADLNMNLKTETEILIEQIRKYIRQENKVTVLQDLEYLVHQYDVAQDFVKLGGIDLLLPDFNSTDDKVRSLVAFTLGSAMQGNPKVQIAVFERNVMQNLLRLVMLDSSREVKIRSLYALSCLLRNFPTAQKTFVHSGGITALADIFHHQQDPSLKLQVKVVTLLHDLLSEQYLTEKYAKQDDKFQQEKLRQYKSFQLEAALQNNGFCTYLPKLLVAPDYDTQEKVINAMQSLVHICKETFSSSLKKLYHLAQIYEKAAIEEASEIANKENSNTDQLYFASVYTAVNNLIQSVNQSNRKEL